MNRCPLTDEELPAFDTIENMDRPVSNWSSSSEIGRRCAPLPAMRPNMRFMLAEKARKLIVARVN